ncbi:unnamed protein product [Amaranthus hypochondriacus]
MMIGCSRRRRAFRITTTTTNRNNSAVKKLQNRYQFEHKATEIFFRTLDEDKCTDQAPIDSLKTRIIRSCCTIDLLLLHH